MPASLPSQSSQHDKDATEDQSIIGSNNSQLEATHPSSHQRRRKLLALLAGLACLVVILALALGLGLGIGLKRDKNKSNTDNSSSVSGTASVPGSTVSKLAFVPRELISDPSQLTLNPAWDRYAPPQDRVYNFTLTEIASNPAGVTKQMRVINGISPGPMVQANIGDRVIVHVDNRMSVPTSLHWHGQYQRGSNQMDGTAGITECGIAPGTTFTYNWTVQQSGSYWYHSHYGPTYSDGLFGPLILHGDDETFRAVNSSTSTTSTSNSTISVNGTSFDTAYDEDVVFVLNDAYQADSFTVAAIAKSKAGPPGGEQGDEPTPDYAMINGLGFANCGLAPNGTACVSDQAAGESAYNFTVPANKRVRMRVINAGSLATFRFSVDGHNMTVIEADATEVEPRVVQSLNVMVAQRYSVIINTDRPADAYAVRAEAMDDMFAYDNPFLVMDQYAIMRYEGIPVSAAPTANPENSTLSNVAESLDTSKLVPLLRMDPPQSNMTTKLVVNFGLDAESDWHAFFNQTTFTSEMAPVATLMKSFELQKANGTVYSDSNEMIVTNEQAVVMDVIINNLDDGEHPFHLHGFTPYILATGAGNYQLSSSGVDLTKPFTNPMRRDVFSVPAFSWIAFRFVADNPGVWPFHCHLTSHMAIGLLMQFQVMPSQIARLGITDQFKNQCSAVHDWVSKNSALLTSTGDPDYM
ncbi:hypothetical protein BCV70DRAFT_219514 [Testicularia cyperi]|uniref:Multicopper oxidase n=1 Tax=Testicularia cyperi TaxID=1882483 RepID=A0A317XGB8_9BASI|nr:hypothetical protein BCV70DRAFT_219514 [Testicularia cyperi]